MSIEFYANRSYREETSISLHKRCMRKYFMCDNEKAKELFLAKIKHDVSLSTLKKNKKLT
jgi:hypothetical protein